jgi:hypothetical protein
MTREATLVETECEYATVSVATDSTTVVNGPCIFYGAVVTTVLSAHALPIMDNATTIAAFAASAAVGTTINIQSGVRCNTSLVVDPDNAATGDITVWFRRLRLDGALER